MAYSKYCNKYKVQQGVPVPPRYQAQRRRRGLSALIASMQKGESFFIPCGKKNIYTARNSVTHASTKVGANMITRTVKENGRIGLRVWRNN